MSVYVQQPGKQILNLSLLLPCQRLFEKQLTGGYAAA